MWSTSGHVSVLPTSLAGLHASWNHCGQHSGLLRLRNLGTLIYTIWDSVEKCSVRDICKFKRENVLCSFCNGTHGTVAVLYLSPLPVPFNYYGQSILNLCFFEICTVLQKRNSLRKTSGECTAFLPVHTR